ncbi:MAG: hypothetical protein ABI847_20540 [Anaerolineales bacterium]
MPEPRLAEWFSHWVGFPAIYRLGWRRPAVRRQFNRLLREKLASQYWPLERQQAQQLARVQALLAHAGAHVPFYRDLFRRLGFDPRDMRSLADLQALPLVDRHLIQAEGRRMLAENLAPAEVRTAVTSGTTGSPFQYAFDPGYYVHNEAAAWVSDLAAGRRMGSRTVYIWGAPYNQTNYRGWRGLSRRWLRNEFHFDSHVLWDTRLRDYHARLQQLSPAVLVGFASSITHLARYLERQGIRPGYPRAAVIPSGEVLEPDMRATLERVFQVPVFNRLGSTEVGLMAYECRQHAGLHLNMPNLVVEWGSPDPREQPAELVITQLWNYAMPMIRYQIGDRAQVLPPGPPCPCGRTSPLLQRVAGRAAATFVTAHGKLIEGYYVINPVALLPGVIDFQVVQETLQELRLRLVTGPEFVPASLAKLHERVENLMGPGTHMTVEQVDAIPRHPSGKAQIALSWVTVARDGAPGRFPPAGQAPIE